MARGYKNQFGDNKVFSGRIRGLQQGEEIFISQQTLEDGDYIDHENIKRVSGEVIKVGIREIKPKKSDPYKVISIHLQDNADKEVFILECGINSIGRSLINTLAGGGNLVGEMVVSVYTSKKGYASLYITLNGERVGWKYSWGTLQEKVIVNQVSEKGEMVERKDYYKLDEWMINEVLLKEVVGNFEDIAEPEPEMGHDQLSDDNGKKEEPVSDDDLPF